MRSPLVSIITVVFNGEAFIEESIASVVAQTYSNIEYIIIDGASTDSTLDIITKYKSNFNHIVSEKDTGIYNAMNKGLGLASGEIIAILNADDYYYPETIELVVTQFEETKADIVYGDLTKLRVLQNKEYFKEEKPNLTLVEETMPIFHPSTFVKKKVYTEIGGFNEVYQLSADYDFIYKAYKAEFQFVYLERALTVFRIGGATASNCKTYSEGYQILKSYQSPHAPAMYKLIGKCKSKNRNRKIALFVINILGLKSWNERRLIKKWK
jgi:glycosyltransferase involved in cell wall biosynthesis